MLEPDEIIELFVSGIILLIGFAVVIQINFETDITPLITGVIELAIPLFMAVFVAVVIINVISDITN